ncbi:MAG: U32 family peptidase [Firmicutes bacterium]|nr:U32 family peptidase [Bacillota bacterium]
MVELLAPAGNMEKLKTAIHFGANAVYLAGESFGLRSNAGFTNAELKDAIEYAHSKNVKVYVAANILAHQEHIYKIESFLKYLQSINADAVIASDLGVISLCKKYCPSLEIHVSTQASVTNFEAIKTYALLGAKRIILARELSLKEIADINKQKKEAKLDIQLEAFVHGAMCVAYSGRCLLSSVMLERPANLGECAQPCRFKYYLTEVKRPNEHMEILEDASGSYVLNSKDLMMVEHLKEMVAAGVTSFKVEGRMKSAYYVANTVNAYKMAINALNSAVCNKKLYVDELKKSSHRDYTTGFYFGKNAQMQHTESASLTQSYDVVASVLENIEDGQILVEHRNRFKVGDVLEVLSPDNNFNKTFTVSTIKLNSIKDKNTKQVTTEGVTVADKVQATYMINCPYKLTKFDILRTKL